MLEGPILATLLRLSAPNLINLVSVAAFILFDGFFVARLGIEALAAASLVFPFLIATQHLAASGMGGAVTSAIARALGAKDREAADALASHAFALALALGVLTTFTMLAAGPTLYAAMGGRGETLAAACRYSLVLFSGAAAIYVLNILASVLRGTGDMTRPALALAGAILGHVLLSPLLIFGFGPLPPMGIAGSALGLILSFATASAVLGAYLRSGRSGLQLRFAGTPYRWPLIKRFLVVGVPGIVNVGVNNMSVALLIALSAQLGSHAQLGYAIGARLEFIVIPLAFVFGTALVAMVGTNWGAGRFGRARRIAWTGGLVAGATCGVVGIAAAILPGLWMRLFTSEPGVIESGSLYLRIVGPMYALFGFGQALYFSSQGFGNPLPAVLANVARFVLVAVMGSIGIFVFGKGAAFLFAAIAAGFALYAALNAMLLARASDPVAPAVPVVGLT
jgi:putative MATE family efflux protein